MTTKCEHCNGAGREPGHIDCAWCDNTGKACGLNHNEIQPQDLNIYSYRSTPKAGFGNSPDDGIAIQHRPTGLEARHHGERSSHANSQKAMEKLRALLADPANDQRQSDQKFNNDRLLARAAKVIGLDPENTSWFEVVGEMEKAAAQPQGELVGFATMRNGKAGSWLHSSQRQAENFDSTAINGKPGNSEIFPVFRQQPAPVAFPGYPPVPEDRKLPAPVAVRMCDCNQGRLPCRCKP